MLSYKALNTMIFAIGLQFSDTWDKQMVQSDRNKIYSGGMVIKTVEGFEMWNVPLCPVKYLILSKRRWALAEKFKFQSYE